MSKKKRPLTRAFLVLYQASQQKRVQLFMGRGLLAVRAARPCFDRLSLQKLHQRRQIFLLIIILQRVIIGTTILLIDNGGRIVIDHQPVVQQRPSHAPVAVRKGVNALKTGMEVRPCLQWCFRANGIDFFNQLRKVVSTSLGCEPTSFLPVT